MKLKLAAILVALASSGPADAQAGRCQPLDPVKCSTTPRIDPKDINAELEAFLGEEKGLWVIFAGQSRATAYVRNAKAIDEVREVLGGPTDPPQQLAGGAVLMSGCRAHSCEEKGAMLYAPDGSILAVGLFTIHAAGNRTLKTDPNYHPSKLLVFSRKTAGLDPATALTNWAQDKYFAARFGSLAKTDFAVEIRQR